MGSGRSVIWNNIYVIYKWHILSKNGTQLTCLIPNDLKFTLNSMHLTFHWTVPLWDQRILAWIGLTTKCDVITIICDVIIIQCDVDTIYFLIKIKGIKKWWYIPSYVILVASNLIFYLLEVPYSGTKSIFYMSEGWRMNQNFFMKIQSSIDPFSINKISTIENPSLYSIVW